MTWTIAWWTQAETELAAAAVKGALQDWCLQWGVDPEVFRVESGSRVAMAGSAGWQCVTGSGDRDGVWATHPDVAARTLAAAVCDDERDASVVSRHGGALSLSAARQGAREMLDALRAHFDWTPIDDDQPRELPAGLERGGLGVTIRVGEASFQLILSAGVARSVTGRVKEAFGKSLANLHVVLGQRAIVLSVALRSVRLEVGNLCSLAVGDVIALDHRLDEPATLYAEDASSVAHAHLSRVGSLKAIRLERAAS